MLLRSLHLRPGPKPLAIQPVQLSLMPQLQPRSRWALRLHHSSRLHFDLRFEMCGVLLSFVLEEKPSLNPNLWVRAKKVGDHDPDYLFSERRIPEGTYGAGPTMPVDGGFYEPLSTKCASYDAEMRAQFAQGDMLFRLEGHSLQGNWRLWDAGTHWQLAKLPDMHSSLTKELALDRSIRSGKRLADL